MTLMTKMYKMANEAKKYGFSCVEYKMDPETFFLFAQEQKQNALVDLKVCFIGDTYKVSMDMTLPNGTIYLVEKNENA